MASSGFQIPGLSTLSGSTSTTPAPIAATTTQPTDTPPAPGNAPTTVPAASEPTQVGNNQTPDDMVVDSAPSVAPINPASVSNDAPSPPSLTEGLEALLGGMEPEAQDGADTAMTEDQPQAVAADATQQGEDEHPEWEEDSSPYESSSDSSDSDDSDDDSEDGEGNPILGPEETARILMEMEGGSDDEGGKGKGGSAAQLRTKNELAEALIPKPDLVITEEMKITELGEIEHIIESTIVIKANTTGEVQVLEPGFPICVTDRTVIAAIADVIGSVRQPRYTAMFSSDEELKTLNLEVGTKIFYPPAHAVSVFTQPLRTEKGTDASNWHDEEAGMEEIEFSDDEKEAEYKRQLKAKKKAGRGGANAAQGTRGQDGPSGASPAAAGGGGLNYDDNDEDGPYRKLTRPTTFGQVGGGSLDEVNTPGSFSRGGRGGRGDSRGRGRGRGGDRGRGGRGSHAGGSGHSLPPRPPRSQDFNTNTNQQQQQQQPVQQPPQQPFNFIPPAPFGGQAFPPPPPPQFQAGQQLVVPPFPFPGWPQGGAQSFVPPPPPPPGQFAGQQGAAAGAYYNPAFLAALQSQLQNQQQQNQQQGQNQQNPSHPQWPGQGHAG
ncbi:Gar1/Naf1 RNA binding region-domain-containing protein [Microdochium bolleyi]|uniref:H/ACA ribonucleoprotein complex non-core subunit NAF1 n=1 Tax=Microdochium bolleyi TaxID=196109 RepID=A0A136ITI9_9PEZI|nr:Gar1/Naf1 RNA binding region-domain-containing protein [Microdochium bolleyi]